MRSTASMPNIGWYTSADENGENGLVMLGKVGLGFWMERLIAESVIGIGRDDNDREVELACESELGLLSSSIRPGDSRP